MAGIENLTQEEYSINMSEMREAFRSFLDSDFLNLKPFEQNDETILSGVEERSKLTYESYLMGRVNILCSMWQLVTVADSEYHGREYKYMVLARKNERQLYYNPSLRIFKQEMPILIRLSAHGEMTLNKKTISTVNGVSENSAIGLLENNVGKDLFLAYDFSVQDEFYNTKPCLRLWEQNITADGMRRQILLSQAFILNYVLNHPEDSTPCIHGRFGYCYGFDEFAVAKKVHKEYLSEIEDKLHEVLSDIDSRRLGVPELI